MTARQPPGEKGAKACTTGIYQSRDWYFCTCFLGVIQKRGVVFSCQYNLFPLAKQIPTLTAFV